MIFGRRDKNIISRQDAEDGIFFRHIREKKTAKTSTIQRRYFATKFRAFGRRMQLPAASFVRFLFTFTIAGGQRAFYRDGYPSSCATFRSADTISNENSSE